jgi:hypothetical protein
MGNDKTSSSNFLAITARGAQPILPGTPLHAAILSKLDSIPTHGKIKEGDILVASDASCAINPEDLGIRREDIVNYRRKRSPFPFKKK